MDVHSMMTGAAANIFKKLGILPVELLRDKRFEIDDVAFSVQVKPGYVLKCTVAGNTASVYKEYGKNIHDGIVIDGDVTFNVAKIMLDGDEGESGDSIDLSLYAKLDAGKSAARQVFTGYNSFQRSIALKDIWINSTNYELGGIKRYDSGPLKIDISNSKSEFTEDGNGGIQWNGTSSKSNGFIIKEISANDDLNTYTTTCWGIITTKAIADTVKNIPFKAANTVCKITAISNYIIQEFMVNGGKFYRRESTNGGTNWGDWVASCTEIAGNAFTARRMEYQAGVNINGGDLNDYKSNEVGYSGVGGNYVNCPTSEPFFIENVMMKGTTPTNVLQTIIPQSGSSVYRRMYDGTSKTWSEFEQYLPVSAFGDGIKFENGKIHIDEEWLTAQGFTKA